MLNSLNKRYKNCMVDGKENFKFDLGVKGLQVTKNYAEKQKSHPLLVTAEELKTALEDKEMEAHMHSTGTN